LFGCFLKETDVAHQSKERIEQFGGYVDDLRFCIIDEQSVEQRHLTFYVADRRWFRTLRQVVRERGVVWARVERNHRSAVEKKEFGQKASDQRFADARARRANKKTGVRSFIFEWNRPEFVSLDIASFTLLMTLFGAMIDLECDVLRDLLFCLDKVPKSDTIIFRRHLGQPMSDIASQDE